LFVRSVLSFLYYGLGGLIFSFFGHFFVRKAKGKTLSTIKKSIALFLKSVLHLTPFVKKTVIRNPNEDFSNPSVIIANHTSFLDTLALAMATHKIVYLVNDWVYDSPVFGKLVRALGFFPVSQGIENGMEKLREKIDQGYSLMVFPEAERSYTNDIKRFHKGAFYIAEQFGLDVVPVYIHGNSEVLPKGDFVIYDGSIMVKVGDRISKDDINFGKNYSERTKKINAYFREQFAKLRNEIENENYFKKKLFLSFLYKETEVVKEIKDDFNINKSVYFELNKHLPKDGIIFHIADDFGQKDVLLTLYQAGRKIFSLINDKEKRDVALQNYIVKRRKINYINDISEMNKKADVLLISDEKCNLKDIAELPETIVFVNVKNIPFENSNYQREYSSESIKVYKSAK
jgi:1-acyl-sn-glycerol-3-phosphate acyltransferase